MGLKLLEDSEYYCRESDKYEKFSRAEDYPENIFEYIKNHFKNKVVVDIGVGNGRFAFKLAPLTKRYIGIDPSKEQIGKAKLLLKGMKNVRLICCSGNKTPLESESAELIFLSFTLDTIKSNEARNNILKECNRILKKRGYILLIENYKEGEFEKIRGDVEHKRHKQKYDIWLKKNSFKIIKIIKTYFLFDSLRDAKKIIGDIWGGFVSNKIESNKINQKIMVLKRKK